MSTPFVYPNGEHIDVFLQVSNGLFHNLSLSDYGQTALYLRGAQVEIESTTTKREILSSILSQLNVRFHKGDLVVDIEQSGADDISDAIFRLSQACLRISDFAAHQRLRSANPLKDDVEGFLEASGFRFETGVTISGRYGHPVKLDFQVFGSGQPSYVNVLKSSGDTDAHSSANEIFRKWYDIGGAYSESHALVTVYSSGLTTLRDADRKRLMDYSKLIAFPSDQELLRIVLEA